MVQHNLEHRRLLRRTFRFIEKVHKGTDRQRRNGDGQPRSYDHHPMEVALFFAEMEIFERRSKHKNLTSEQVAKKILAIVERIADMDKPQLKRRLLTVSRQMNNDQMTTLVGLLCHDAVEEARKKGKSRRKKIKATKECVAGIRALREGAEKIAKRLTDARKHTDKKQKRKHQIKLARRRKYASVKKYDIIINMFDQMLIPDSIRDPVKKRAVLEHMHEFMCEAYQRRHISFAYYRASDLIYQKAMAQLG